MTAWIMVPWMMVLEGLAITSACVTVEGSAPFSTKSVTSPKVRSVRAVSFAPEVEQIFLEKKVVGGASNYLKEGVLVTAFCYEDSVCALEIPQFLELMVTQTDVIDDTVPVSNATKLAVLETGAKLDVPPFVEVGDIVKVDTLKNDFVQRV